MATEKRSRPATPRPAVAGPRKQRLKIPLPPLSSRSPDAERPAPAPVAAAAARTLEEMARDDAEAQDALLARIDFELPADPTDLDRAAHSAGEPERARTGAIGASVMNDLVDEIERDLEKEAARHAPAGPSSVYGRTVGCTFSRR